MPRKINVLKRFTFSYPPHPDHKLHREKQIEVGEQEIDEVMANHPWIREHYADGCIERPEAAVARADAAKATADKTAAEAKAAIEEAERAYNRTVAMAASVAVSPEQLEKDLNTPINRLAAEQGTGIDSATPAVEASKEGGGKKAKAA